MSNSGDSSFDWIVGAFYMDQETNVYQLSYNPGMNEFHNACVDQGLCRLIRARHQGGKVWAQRNARRAGQRGHRHKHVGLFLGRKRQSIGQNQPPFGIGVVDLDRQPLA